MSLSKKQGLQIDGVKKRWMTCLRKWECGVRQFQVGDCADEVIGHEATEMYTHRCLLWSVMLEYVPACANKAFL